MKEIIGYILIFSAINVGGVFAFGEGISLKEKLYEIAIFEIFICSLTFGAYLVTG